MKKIFILTWVSYTDEDDYLYSDVKVFTDEKEARKQYDKDCENAYEACEWGSQWDEPEEKRDEDCKYDVDESRDDNEYTVASSAYNGYKVKISLDAKEVGGEEDEKMLVLCSYDIDEQEFDEHLVVSPHVLKTRDGKKRLQKKLKEMFEYENLDEVDREEFRECMKGLLKGKNGVGYFGIKYFWEEEEVLR